MFKNKVEGIRSEKGFTMIELIIVIAIMGILSAILVPSFTEMTRKSRLRSDISTIQQVDMQINLFIAEQDGLFPGGTTPAATGALTSTAVKALVDAGYIKGTDITGGVGSEAIKLQSATVVVNYDTSRGHLVLDVEHASVDAQIKATAAKLGDSDKLWTNTPVTPGP